MVLKNKLYSIRSKVNKKSKKYKQYLRYKKSTIKKKLKKKYTKKKGGGVEGKQTLKKRISENQKSSDLYDGETIENIKDGKSITRVSPKGEKETGEGDIPSIDIGKQESYEDTKSVAKDKIKGNTEILNDTKTNELAAAAAASSFSDSSKITDIPSNFEEGLEYNNPEIEQIKEQFKQQLNKLAVIIKNIANESEEWNSEENEKNIEILKNNTIKQIDNVGIPVASAIAKTAGVLTGTTVKEVLMASGIMEVLTALKAAIITLKTVIDLVNDLGITEEAAPFVREKIKNLIGKVNSYSQAKESITKQIEVVPTPAVTKQNFKIMDAQSGKQISDVELNQPEEGDQLFSVSKK